MVLTSALPTDTPTTDDAVVGVDDLGGTPITKKFLISALHTLYNSITATLTNKTFDANGTGNSISNIDVEDLSIGTDGELITWDASGNPTTVAVGTAGHVLKSNGAGSAPTFQDPAITFTEVINLTIEVGEGSVAYPDIHTLATAGAKVTGFVLPDGASSSTINFKGVVPKDLASSPSAKLRFRIMTMGAVAGPADVRLLSQHIAVADTEVLDQALINTGSAGEETVTMPTTIETIDYYEVNFQTQPSADDTIIGQLTRDPTDVADDFTDDIMIIGVDLIIDRTVT